MKLTHDEKILREIVSEYGNQVLYQSDQLQKECYERGMDQMQFYHLSLLLQTQGARELVWCGNHIRQTDINCLAMNAALQSGLTRLTITRTIALLVTALGYDKAERYEDAVVLKTTDHPIMIPIDWTSNELNHIMDEIVKDSEKVNSNIMIKLNQLCELGEPRAFYMKGILLSKSHPKEAKENLLLAAQDGIIDAMSNLGDYYYYGNAEKRNWTKAYQYYTEYGTNKLNNEQMKNVKMIRTQKRYNRNTCVIGALLLCLFLLLMIVNPFPEILAFQSIGMYIVFGIDVVLYGLCIFRSYKRPYDFYDYFIHLMFILWALRCLFNILFW